LVGKVIQFRRLRSRELLRITHPCMNAVAHEQVGRIHVPVAPRCNIHCNYCDRSVGDCVHQKRPGMASTVMSPRQAVETIRRAVQEDPRNRIIGIAGPGEPLDNEETLETLRLAREEFPEAVFCVCTNGLHLPERIADLVTLGVNHLTITINFTDPQIGALIHPFVRYRGKTYRGVEGARLLHDKHLEGLSAALNAGMFVKINSVCVPGINMEHLVEVAKTVGALGTHVQNIMPLIPVGRFRHLEPPSVSEMARIRRTCELFIPQYRSCRQCPADAIGVCAEG